LATEIIRGDWLWASGAWLLAIGLSLFNLIPKLQLLPDSQAPAWEFTIREALASR